MLNSLATSCSLVSLSLIVGPVRFSRVPISEQSGVTHIIIMIGASTDVLGTGGKVFLEVCRRIDFGGEVAVSKSGF